MPCLLYNESKLRATFSILKPINKQNICGFGVDKIHFSRIFVLKCYVVSESLLSINKERQTEHSRVSVLRYSSKADAMRYVDFIVKLRSRSRSG